jgi:hypothetical protein
VRSIRKILFVYNADRGLLGVRDADHCALREITHSGGSERTALRRCRVRDDVPTVGVYKNQLDSSMAETARETYPSVIVDVDGRFLCLLDRTAIERCRDEDDPVAALESALRAALVRFALSG